MRMICGKYDSLWKWDYQLNPHSGLHRTRRRRGHFDTAMNYARKNKGGVALIQHARNQPWETWVPSRG